MKLSEEAIREYQEIYKDEFGEEISYDKASEQARSLLTLFEVITRRK